MKATTLLREDHARVKKLFTQFGRTTERAVKTRARLVARIAMELTVHAQIEEEIFYPAVEEVDALGRLVDESRKEHAEVKKLVAELQRMDPAGDAIEEKVTTLRKAVVHHAIEEEERRMFPKLEAELGDDALSRLGLELKARKLHLMKHDEKPVRRAA
jgi:hemerythrin superfamily protein